MEVSGQLHALVPIGHEAGCAPESVRENIPSLPIPGIEPWSYSPQLNKQSKNKFKNDLSNVIDNMRPLSLCLV
jgi:hypothetical protein